MTVYMTRAEYDNTFGPPGPGETRATQITSLHPGPDGYTMEPLVVTDDD